MHLCYRCLHTTVCKISSATSIDESSLVTITDCQEFLDETSLAELLKEQTEFPLPDFDEVLQAIKNALREAQSSEQAAHDILSLLGFRATAGS